MKPRLPVKLLSAILLLFTGMPPVLADAEEDFGLGYAAYTRREYAQTLSLWLRAAEQGHPRAQNGLGVLYRDGLGTAKSDAVAVRWFRESAESGYAFGMFNLGLMYRDGSGVARDDIEALKWFSLASAVHYDRDAAVQRGLLARRMSAAQTEEARARAQAWFDRFFFGKSSKISRPRGRVPTTE